MLSLTAVLLHAAVFSGAGLAWPQAEPAPLPAATMQVRTIEAPLSQRVAAPVDVPLVEVRAAANEAPQKAVAPIRGGHRSTPPSAAAEAARASVATPAQPVAAEVPSKDTAPAILLAQNPSPASVAMPAPLDEETLPKYRTLMPPAATLRYEMQRGMLHGTGELSWRPQGDRYELKLDAKVSGLSLLTQTSSGDFDSAGIAPLRYTDQRLRKGAVAANFQRGPATADKITFSGSSAELPLRVGAQDRLSWMIQLAAIVAADPQLAKPGAKVAMYVVGANGDASVWAFRCVGPETLDTRAGRVETIKFMREPREPYDTTVQVWLDPHRHSLPLRAVQKSGGSDEVYDLRLQEAIFAG